MTFLSHVFPKLWCAGKLGNCPKTVNRFRWTCLHCLWRRRYLGKFIDPPYWIDYTPPWSVTYYVAVNEKGEIIAKKTNWFTYHIDPRGHFTSFRCAAIVALDKIMAKIKRVRYPFREFCEFFAHYPTW